MGSMGKIQAGHVHACGDEPTQNLFRIAGGTDGADDFRFAHGISSGFSKNITDCSPNSQAPSPFFPASPHPSPVS
jgi:hypothetical protein